jgi:Holliday junction resolvasome RuvABC DNA-binding subunit
MNKKDKKDSTNDYGDFPSKFAKKLPPGFNEAAQSMSIDELKKKLVECERTISSTEKDQENDPKLMEAKEEVAALSIGYKEILAAHKAMVKFLVWNIDERGTP